MSQSKLLVSAELKILLFESKIDVLLPISPG